jgi:polyphosphate kinase 2 (PPK2 family)
LDHLSKKELKRRLKKLEDDTLQAWRVRPEDWKQAKKYEEYTTLAEEMVAQTGTGRAPWTLVEGDCQRWARVKVLTQMAATITEALERLADAICTCEITASRKACNPPNPTCWPK